MSTTQLGLMAGIAPVVKHTGDKRLVTEQQLTSLVNWASTVPELSYDYETKGGKYPWKGAQPFMVSFYAPDKGAKVLDLRLVPNGRQAVVDINKRRKGVTIVHHGEFEAQHTEEFFGVEIGGQLWDNQCAAFALNEQRKTEAGDDYGKLTQKNLVEKEVDRKPVFAPAVKAWLNANMGGMEEGWDRIPMELIVPYGCEDVIDAFDLYKTFKTQAEKRSQVELIQTDSEFCRVLADINTTGLQLDLAYAKQLLDKLNGEMKAIYKAIRDAVGRDVDLASHTQLFGLLYGELRLPMHGDQEKKGKLDDTVLEWMCSLASVKSDPRKLTIVDGLRNWRERDKVVGTYLMPWLYEFQQDGVLHPDLNQTGPETRRLSSSKPNLQNIPARGDLGPAVRHAIACALGFTTFSIDYSQVEYRGFTHYCGEPTLVRGYRNDPNFDIHEQVAQMLGVKRKDGKNLNFGLLYGMGQDKLARSLLRTKDEAKQLLNAYHARIPTIKQLKRKLENEIRGKGYVRDLFGATRHMTVQESYKALNSLCQMTAASLMKSAMVRTRPTIRKAGGRQLLQIHDEQLFQLPGGVEDNRATVKEVRAQMEDYPQFKVPIRTDCEWFTTHWDEAKPL